MTNHALTRVPCQMQGGGLPVRHPLDPFCRQADDPTAAAVPPAREPQMTPNITLHHRPRPSPESELPQIELTYSRQPAV